MYDRVPSIEEKDEFVVDLTRAIDRPEFTIEAEEDVRAFLRDLVGFYVIMEGIFFYAGFAMMLGLKRQNKMVGIGQQFEYIMRDESLHVGFGVDLINQIRAEQFAEYVEHVADRRLGQLDLPAQYGTDNPFPWMSEQVDLNKGKNFFETQMTEYQSGASLDW
jgi:ribonucleoside-diphosphate reductase beta chain